ncbi:hypothetical protein ACXR0M_13530 [Pseudomonas sp. Eth.TT006]
MNKSMLVLLLGALTLSGCGTRFPSVQYEKVTAKTTPDLEGLVKFNLPKTILKLDRDKDKKLVLEAIPGESEDNLFQIHQDDPWLIKTSFKWVKRENTNLLQSVGTEVEDNRIKTIQAVGGALASIAAVLFTKTIDLEDDGGPVPPAKAKVALPLAIDTEPFLSGYTGENLQYTAENGSSEAAGKVGFTLSFGPLPPATISLKDYLSATQGKSQHAIFIPACRSARIKFTDQNSELSGLEFVTTVADPNYVQIIGLPNKGTVNFHSVCGANVLAEKADISTGSELVNASLAEAKSLSETWTIVKKNAADERKAKDAEKAARGAK